MPMSHKRVKGVALNAPKAASPANADLLTAFFTGRADAQDAFIAPDLALTQKNPAKYALIGWEGKLRFHALSAYGPTARP